MSQKFDIHLVYKIILYRISLISRDSQTFGMVQKCLKMLLFISHKHISFLKPFSSLFFCRHSGRDRAKKVKREKPHTPTLVPKKYPQARIGIPVFAVGIIS